MYATNCKLAGAILGNSGGTVYFLISKLLPNWKNLLLIVLSMITVGL